ncbi:phosphatidate cytidylyltransferase [Roseivivax isoporae]|uniref:Phosphatidate cytidylyltransferase n=1 Tax=Roseivivax isoporae LMG 25204 TaxID=1449351 RepID=X7FDA3_9RHOB|nr:phosphatidate cytidylyltransferase [Roseivivax isoporae]ETX30743.1 phosphatidate cytidylyltransferase [Roseivivax isoporae LMG 25204]
MSQRLRSKWDDLGERLLSGAVLVGLGSVCVWIGGTVFHLLVAAVCGMMVWELVSMLDTRRERSPLILGVAAAAAMLVASEVPASFALPLVLAPSMLGLGQMERGGVTYASFAALILLAGYGMIVLRDVYGAQWLLWLILVVVTTDVAGYFAGRSIGGKLLWPRVSPKKTWAGAIAGWVAAGGVGVAYAMLTPAHAGLMGLSIAASMASQIGDIAESAVKRRAGVKDSSNLIPGHGGLFDRFDGMLGASVFILIAGQITGFPPGIGPALP